MPVDSVEPSATSLPDSLPFPSFVQYDEDAQLPCCRTYLRTQVLVPIPNNNLRLCLVASRSRAQSIQLTVFRRLQQRGRCCQ